MSIANIESGERRLDVVELLDLASVIGFDPHDLRAGRALLGWSQTELAKAAKLSRPSAERTAVSADTLAAIRKALEKAGVAFTNGGEPGVKLRKRK